ncbi:cytochrome P450 3A6-like [Branchiostoma floridae]|uniref:Cytochrome P450 3A6-like n=1 Tax=Branchiostoma floridae TaxID=7739 RepID=A0A9J7LXD7_BRAFL|nr:cytochrome P450 3A6-like [Branchiostoma floridae]
MENLEKMCSEGTTFDVKRVFGCFSMDVIASTAFGVDVNSHKNPQDAFVENARKIDITTFTALPPYLVIGGLSPDEMFSQVVAVFTAGYSNSSGLLANTALYLTKNPDVMDKLQRILSYFLPKYVLQKLGFAIFPADVVSFFRGVFDDIVDERSKQPPDQRRVDLLELMTRSNEDKIHKHLKDDEGERGGLSPDEMFSQVVAVFTAGYSNSSGLLANTALYLTKNPDVMDKLQHTTMKWITVPAGTEVVVDTGHLHMDHGYWEDPMTFNPV